MKTGDELLESLALTEQESDRQFEGRVPVVNQEIDDNDYQEAEEAYLQCHDDGDPQYDNYGISGDY